MRAAGWYIVACVSFVRTNFQESAAGLAVPKRISQAVAAMRGPWLRPRQVGREYRTLPKPEPS